ncbi:MAG: bifunctional phosphoribosylaminoimidazolecarboxamide formyltransferase/IMP cyclohydrolase, partial [Bacteroidota bacterium]
MSNLKKIQSALISVYNKNNLEPVIKKLEQLGVTIYSTGGTRKFIENLGVKAIPIEEITDYPSILSGRVKTLHPKIFGGILFRRDNEEDRKEQETYEIPEIDLVVVDLYPFEETLKNTQEEDEIIEKIDIGGISLIRAAAKNYKNTLVIPSKDQYDTLMDILNNNGETTILKRKEMALEAFDVSSHYDTVIFNYFNRDFSKPFFKQSEHKKTELRYGENPHQMGIYYGDFDELFDQLHGKQISYNNLIDIDAAVHLIADFDPKTFAILKHNNACGIATRQDLLEAWKDALAGDPVSAFGGILITNSKVDSETAEEINKLFFEVIIAPAYDDEALGVL